MDFEHVRLQEMDYGRKIGAALCNEKGEWFAVMFYETDTDAEIMATAALLRDWLDGKHQAGKITGRDTLTGSEHRDAMI